MIDQNSVRSDPFRWSGFLAGHCQKLKKAILWFIWAAGGWRFRRAVSVGQLKERKGRVGVSGTRVPGVVYLVCASVGMRAEDGFQGAWTPARASNTRLSHVIMPTHSTRPGVGGKNWYGTREHLEMKRGITIQTANYRPISYQLIIIVVILKLFS